MRVVAIIVAAIVLAACSKVEEKQTEKIQIVDLQACKAKDDRTHVPVWTPTYDEWSETLSSSPPQGNGKIVYIALRTDAESAKCSDEELNSFRSPSDRTKPSDGGIVVNMRGNSQFANGYCHFAGFFMNKDVIGLHQGWGETYFGSIGMQEILLSGRYCLSEPVQEPDTATLAVLSADDKLITIHSIDPVAKKDVYGKPYQELYVSFSEKGDQTKQRAACGGSVCDSVMPQSKDISEKAAKVILQSRLADNGSFEPIIMKIMLLK